MNMDRYNNDWVKFKNRDRLDCREDNLRLRDRSSGKVIQSWRDINIYRQYGITSTKYNELLIKQNNLCAICYGVDDHCLNIDHCHKNSLIRGLLCHHCNIVIGKFKDNPMIIEKAIKYLS